MAPYCLDVHICRASTFNLESYPRPDNLGSMTVASTSSEAHPCTLPKVSPPIGSPPVTPARRTPERPDPVAPSVSSRTGSIPKNWIVRSGAASRWTALRISPTQVHLVYYRPWA